MKMGSENVIISKYLKKPVRMEILPEVKAAIELVKSKSFYQYDCFLSYAAADAKKCQYIVNHLTQRGVRVWFDRDKIKPGNHITARIDEGLEKSHKIIAAFSPDFFQKNHPWPRAEITSKVINDPLGTDRALISIIIEDCEVPPVLSNIRSVDFRDESKFDEKIEELITALTYDV